ncbi:MAG: hypothetical protein M1832_005100 [Thelocarpon impressellum]|nr:MAG: hypothetical protein M1832_005100 [Thelocarpon impressellum]
MALSDKEFRRLYAGNVLWYQRFAESSRPSFLQRNINAVLRSHERQSARVADEGRPPVKPASVPVSAAGSEPNGQMKRGSLINSIADRLTPYDFGFTQSRQVLRIDVKSLKRKRDESGPTRDYAEEVGGNGSISSRNRCKCEITIWHAPRSTSGPRNRQLQLLRDSQMCTVLSVRRSNEDSHAIVELDQPFLIGLSKLLVPTSRGKVEKLALAESYRTQISLQPFFSPGKGWPPFSVRSGRTETAQAPCSEASRLPSHVVAKLDGSLKLLSGERMLQVKLDVAQGQPKIDTDFVLHVEALWSKPRSSLPISGLKEGELLSDSDGEPDEAWLRQKHAETIDDFSDVSGPEKEFIKAFDEFMFEEHVPANRFLPEVLHAFTRRNSAWLRRSDMSIEFLKHGTKLVQYGMLDPRILHDCASMIRQQGMDDEEMGDAEATQHSASAEKLGASDRNPSARDE